MPAERAASLDALPGYRWLDNGQSAFNGELLDLYRRLDALFMGWAAEERAQEYVFPTLIPARELAKLDYFRSFPQLVTFPAVLDRDARNLESFGSRDPMEATGEVHLTTLAPVRDVLTPAACYHFYIQFQGERLERPRYVTTRATCFRREEYYAPLERQWSFSMREIVCVGMSDEVKAFLARCQERVDRFLKRIGLPIEWAAATDPFFNPSRNPKYLLQKLDPVKTEMVFEGRLAIGSVNFHRNYFGEAFGITAAGEAAFSGCVAFGIERWMKAVLTQFGTRLQDWPALVDRAG